MQNPSDRLMTELPKADTTGLHSEKLYALWNIATQHHLGDQGRIQAILAESCKVLGVDVALVGELIDGSYYVRYAHDPSGSFVAGMELPLAATPCQRVVEQRCSLFLPDLPSDPLMGTLPVVSRFNLKLYAGTPIWVDDQLWGVLAYASGTTQGMPYARDNLAFIELIANWIALLQVQAVQRGRLEKLALTDEMTGLPNRRAAESRLKEEIALARRMKRAFVLGLVDLDHFKLVNDRYGHRVGDEVLARFADAFSEHLRADDWVARWGGEEFLVCLHGDDLQQAETAFERVREAICQQAFETSAGKVHLTISAGVSCFDLDHGTQDAMLALLDSALYEAKSRGRNRIVSGKQGMGMLQIASLLKEAASEDRILAAYQPMVDLKTRKIVADEALARLQTPHGDILAAASFIDAAEGLNLMAEIDAIVAGKTMARCAAKLVEKSLLPGFAHFINLSPQFLSRRDLVEKLLGSAQGYCQYCGAEMGPLKPIVFEITERQAFMNLDTLEQDLSCLLDFGFRLALDDFGSGYSSFLYLSRLPVSFLKIEGWLIHNLQKNPKVLALVRSLVDFSRNQGITTIAECVEDEETACRLHEIGVDWAQGYYFGYPELSQTGVYGGL
jgi:diguanylate cyclase (GGDEF)-like protein